MSNEEVDYKMVAEKVIAAVLIAASLWFMSDASRYGFMSEYFKALKLGFFIMSLVLAFRVFTRGLIIPSLVSLIIGLIYNPFGLGDLDRDDWWLINIVTAFSFAWILWKMFQTTKLMTPGRVSRLRLADERSKLIDEGIKRGDIKEEDLDRLKAMAEDLKKRNALKKPNQ